MSTLTTLNESLAEQDTYPEPTAKDRCDRCGAQAYVRVYKDNIERLLFCKHHGNRHHPALIETDHVVLDYSYMLEPLVSEPEK